MTHADLLNCPIGQPMTLHCRTTDRSIYYQGDGDMNRQPISANDPFRNPHRYRALPYTVTGRLHELKVQGREFLVLKIVGEAPVIRNGKVVGLDVREKLCQTPMSAIVRITGPLEG